MNQSLMNLVRGMALILVLFLASPGYCQDDDPASSIQGEYSGDIGIGGPTLAAGCQVIALADNKFQARFIPLGLPGDGGKFESSSLIDPVELNDGKLVFQFPKGKAILKDGVIEMFVPDGQSIGKLERVVRKSETLGMKAPKNAQVLFDGTSSENFKLNRGDGEPVVDGLLRQGIISKQKFNGDFDLHIEFRLPFEKTKSGQGRGNSGIYVQGRYEVQMLDSFGLTGEHNECGGIYSVEKPSVNMCYPPGSWQTYDIQFQSAKWDGDKKTENARMTVKHNGVMIHDDVEVPKATTAAPLKESSEPGFIYLQDHGSPVRYRNIWLLEK